MATAHPGTPVDDVEPDPTAVDERRISRRRWVRDAVLGGTVAAAGAGLAACTSAGPRASGAPPGATAGAAPETRQTGGSGTRPGTTTTPVTAPKLPTAPAGEQTTTEPFHSVQLGRTSAIPVGGGVVYRTQGVVVTQPTAGAYQVFSTSCTHLGCLVNKVADGLIQCPCHGARFSIVDGSVEAGPAPRGLNQEGFSVQNGVIHLD